MIRVAKAQDIPAMIGHARSFYEVGDLGVFDADYMADWLFEHIDHDNFLFMVTETGSCGMCVSQHFATGDYHVQELWVWDEGGSGMKLIKEMIKKAEESGAAFMGVGVQVKLRGDTLARAYERMGFVRKEIILIKALGG